MQRDIPLAPVSTRSRAFLAVLAAGGAAFFVWVYLNSTAGLAPDKAREQIPGLLLVLALMGVAFGVIWWALGRTVVTLTDSGLQVRAGFYGRTLRRSQLQLAHAVEVSLFDRGDLAPRWRTNGIGLPGFRAGWFRLRNRDKALVLLTDPYRVTYLPTTEGYVLLLSTSALLPALRGSAENAPPA